MKNMNVLIWVYAWGQYHQKNYGAAQALLDKINLDLESDEFKENFELFPNDVDGQTHTDNR